MRPSGAPRATRASTTVIALSVGASDDQIGVFVPPGVTWLPRMPRGATSDARLRVMERTPPLAAAYADQPGIPSTAGTDPFRIIEGPSRRWGRAACTVKNTAASIVLLP